MSGRLAPMQPQGSHSPPCQVAKAEHLSWLPHACPQTQTSLRPLKHCQAPFTGLHLKQAVAFYKQPTWHVHCSTAPAAELVHTAAEQNLSQRAYNSTAKGPPVAAWPAWAQVLTHGWLCWLLLSMTSALQFQAPDGC